MLDQIRFLQGHVLRTGRRAASSNHLDLMHLLDELGLELQKFEDEGQTLYFFKGKFRTDKDILDPKTQSGAYVSIANRIHDDAQNLGCPGHWTDHARQLDNMSLKKYLDQFRGQTIGGKTIDDWVIDLSASACSKSCC